MPKKLMRCVRKVKAKGGNVNPYAVCISSTGQKPHRKKKGKK
jgi:hypothetical protein